MDRYEGYTLQDFLDDEDFIRWVKYPDAGNGMFWEAVREAFPHQVPVMEQARALIDGLALYYPEVPRQEVEKGREMMLSRLDRNKDGGGSRRSISYIFKIAASVTLLVAAGWWFSRRGPAGAPGTGGDAGVEQSWKEARNEGAGAELIRLADGSLLTLKPGGYIRYRVLPEDRAEPASKREIYLEGEAFFEVARNEERPFLVYANGLITKVLGTSFTVTAPKNAAAVKVEVSSGRVAVYSEKAEEGKTDNTALIITPNQQVIFRKNEELFQRAIVERPRILVSPEQIKLYTYSDAPVASIFRALEEVYGIPIRYDEELFRNCRLTMALSDESLYEKLDLISKVLEAGYKIENTEIIFSGAGCHD